MRRKATLSFMAIASMAVACGGDDPTPGGSTGGTGGNPGTGGSPGSLQQQAVTNGQVVYHDGTGLTVNTETLAVDVSTATATIGAPATSLPAAAFFSTADYYGAVDPATTAGNAWWQGWTYINSAVDGSLPGTDMHPLEAEVTGGTITPNGSPDCTAIHADFADAGTVDIFGVTFPVCVIDEADLTGGGISSDTTLTNDYVYVLKGTINIGNGTTEVGAGTATFQNVTLTINAGTQLYASAGTATPSVGTATSLVITRGSKIEANGTAAAPIVMASVRVAETASKITGIAGTPTDMTGRGLWGGIVVSGFGDVNTDADDTLTEAAPDTAERWFGGNDNTDDSGTISYIVIAESGFEFRTDQEVQGLTLEAVGSGTTIEYVQVVASEDDCVEWFGGAVGMKYLICNGVDDDGLDIDLGYQGDIQFAIVLIGALNGDHGFETDGGTKTNFDVTPYTSPRIANVTIFGNSGKTSKETVGAYHTEGFRGQLYRTVFTDYSSTVKFEDGCLDVDKALPTELKHYDSVFNCGGGPLSNDTE